MKFLHIADCHIGGWREEALRDLGIKTFEKVIDYAINNNIGFILISGDLFNTALPDIELIKKVAHILKKANEENISVYIIAGSHDFSSSGKTMIEVLERAGLVENVMKIRDNKLEFIKDKTGVKITGLLGRKGGLEKEDYNAIDFTNIEEENGFKIFMFHTALTEFKPREMEKMDSISVMSLPKNFNYYAGGHVHYILEREYGKGKLVYPGALFPNNFKELEEFKHGGFYLGDDKGSYEYIPVKLKDVINVEINANDKNADEIEKEILKRIKDYKDRIVTIRIEGILREGKPGDINFKKIFSKFKDAYCVLKNTNKLTSKEFEEIKVQGSNVEEIEERIINEHKGQIKVEFSEEEMAKRLMEVLAKEREEGEKVMDFEKRILKEMLKAMKLEEIWNDS